MSEYKSLIKAIVDNGIIDYIKLQHPNNRKKRYLQEAYYTSIALFFDDSFRLDLFADQNGEPLSLNCIKNNCRRTISICSKSARVSYKRDYCLLARKEFSKS